MWHQTRRKSNSASITGTIPTHSFGLSTLSAKRRQGRHHLNIHPQQAGTNRHIAWLLLGCALPRQLVPSDGITRIRTVE